MSELTMYQLDEINKLGEPRPFKPEKGPTVMTQTWWGRVREAQMPVMFSKKADIEFAPGDQIACEGKKVRPDKNGNDYLLLEKVQRLSGGSQGGGEVEQHSPQAIKEPKTQAATPLEAKVDEILQHVRKLADAVPDTVIDVDIGDAPINLDDIPF